MRLENFEIHSSIELQTGNLFWDLHNVADFVGLELIPTENTAVMRWSVPAESNPWGCYENKFSGMTLRFKDLQLLHLGARDRELPLMEDTCVSDVLKVDPTIEGVEPYKRTRHDWKPTDSFPWRFNSKVAESLRLNQRLSNSFLWRKGREQRPIHTLLLDMSRLKLCP